MHLKRIVLKGFKSFAERTEILFDDGVTGIVGPNGCGKSNVVDAFRWVMGEQSAKSMRGGKMLDVIFAGSTTRKRADAAEVAITFSDVGDSLPVPYDEVEVSRRLNQAGESEYRLNGQPVRQRDIHSLFWDSGLGKDAFAIFEQGKVDEIVMLNPLDRRSIFDQVAGIKRFRERRKEAVRKLTQMEGNVTRLKDLLREEAKRLRGLEKQVAEAASYRERRDRLRYLEQAVLYTKWVAEDAQRKEASASLAGLDATAREKKDGQEKIEADYRAAKGIIAHKEARLRRCTQELYQNRSSHEVRAAKRAGAERQVDQTRDRVDEVTHALEELARAAQVSTTAITQAERKLAELTQEEIETQASLESAEELAEGVQHEVDALRQQQRAALAHTDSLVSAAHSTTARVREYAVRCEATARRIKELEEEQEGLREQIETQRTRAKEKRTSVSALSATIDRRKKRLLDLTAEFDQKRAQAKELRQELEQLAMALAEKRARQQVLRRMQQEGDGLSSGARTLLKEMGGALVPLHEAVAIPKGLEAAAASVLGAYTQTLIASSDRELNQAMTLGHDLGLTDLSLATQGTVDQMIATLVPVEPEALSPDGVTKEGHHIDANGVFFFPVKGERSSIVREAELKELTPLIKEGESQAASLEAELANLTGMTQGLRSERDELEALQRRDEMKLVEVNFILQQLLTQEVEANKRLQQLGDDRDRSLAQEQELAQELAHLQETEKVAQSELQSHRSSSEATESGLEEALGKLRRFLDAVRQKDAAYKEAAGARERATREVQVLQARGQERTQETQRLKQHLNKLQTTLEELVQELHDASQDKEGSVPSIEEAEANVKEAEEELTSWSEQLAELQEQMTSGNAARTAYEKETHKLQLHLASHASRAEALESELTERFACAMSDLEGTVLDVTLVEGEREMSDLRRSLGASDSVNLGAFEEFEAQQKGHDSLAAQVEDLTQSKRELQKLISQLDRTSRKQFKKSFEQVRNNFQEQFETLFEGGEADLKFTGSDDVLEAGVEIVARPPGKQLRSISLLSGGEKCLTAMALLFAMFQVKPAPFCILDEMDAPLDDSNIRRFLNVLGPLLDTTQFIIVTHNKRTMSVADRLVGVSMEHKGISKLISVAFEKEAVGVS